MSIVITGNPGVGKHTITKKIVERLGLSIVDINKIAKDEGLFEKNQDTNDVDTEKLKKIIGQKISEKDVIVGHLAPYVLNKKNIKIMIVLRRDPYELISVYKERGYSDEKTKENAGSEVLGIIANDAKSRFQEKVFQINISDKSIQEGVEKVVTLISSNEGNDEVDWLELIRKNNDFGKFFVD